MRLANDKIYMKNVYNILTVKSVIISLFDHTVIIIIILLFVGNGTGGESIYGGTFPGLLNFKIKWHIDVKSNHRKKRKMYPKQNG